MTISEIYDTAEKLKEDIAYITNMMDEVAAKLYKENNTPERWIEGLREMEKDLRSFHKDIDNWKIEKMTKKLVDAMATGRMDERRMLEISQFINQE